MKSSREGYTGYVSYWLENYSVLGAIVTEIDISMSYSTIQSVLVVMMIYLLGEFFLSMDQLCKWELMGYEKGIGKWKIDDRRVGRRNYIAQASNISGAMMKSQRITLKKMMV